jgi:hypothetical protein
MKNQKFLKIAGVLLLSAVLLFSASAVTANTTTLTTSIKATGQPQGSGNSRDLIWDNDLSYEALLASQMDPTYGELGTCADDFQLASTTDVTDVHWTGGFWNGAPAPIDWQITFYNDDGSGNLPGTILAGPLTFLYADCNEVFIELIGTSYFYSYEVTLPDAVTCQAGVKYWIAFQGQLTFPPQSGMAAHTAPQQLHQMVFKSAYFGYPTWVDGSTVWPGINYDLAFQLTGGAPTDNTPPVTTCVITGTNPVTITLTATDDISGVNFTKYKIDDGSYATYTGPVVVSEVGDHVVYFYSVDFAGNVETEKSKAFTVEGPTISITIKGGFGVSATIKNTGTTDLTDIDWTIALDGKLIFVGKAKSGTIAALAAGESATVKDFVFGFGKTGIVVTAGDAEATASGTALLIFVIGVK